MDLKERFLASTKRKPVDRVPCASPLQTATVDLMNKCGASWPEAFRNAEKMATLSAAAYEIGGIESVRVPFDLSVEAETLGCKIKPGLVNVQPQTLEGIINSPDDVGKVKVPDPKTAEPMATVLKAVKILKGKYPDKVPIIGAALGPMTLAGHVNGIEKFLVALRKQQDFARSILDFATQVSTTYSLALVEAGADVISLIDPSATGEILGPRFEKEFATPYTKKVVEQIHKAGVPVILHICGKSTIIWDSMVETGSDMLSISEQVDMAEAKQKIGSKVALAGNINPIQTLQFGTPQDVEKAVKECIEKGVDNLCPGCGFTPNTSLENMKKMTDACRAVGAKR